MIKLIVIIMCFMNLFFNEDKSERHELETGWLAPFTSGRREYNDALLMTVVKEPSSKVTQ